MSLWVNLYGVLIRPNSSVALRFRGSALLGCVVARWTHSLKSAEELAQATDTHAPSLYRVLRALASAGIFAEDQDQRFHSTSLAATLQSDLPGSLRFFAMTELGEEHYPAWEHALYSVKTGEIAFNHRFGMPMWEFFAANPENARIFYDAMANLTTWVNEATLSSYDFSPFSKTVDVAGGHGSFIIGILKANPMMRGFLFDLPRVMKKAKQRISEEGSQIAVKPLAATFSNPCPKAAMLIC